MVHSSSLSYLCFDTCYALDGKVKITFERVSE